VRRLFTPTLQISLGLLSVTISLILVACSLGLVPNEERAALELRAKISENIAIQLANPAGRSDPIAIKDSIASIVSRNKEVLSIAVRGTDGKVLAASENHNDHWREPDEGGSTATSVRVSLMNAEIPEGKIEIAFRPLATSANMVGLSRTMIGFIGFMVAAGFPGFYLILTRALRELDPSRAIPARVKAAFDTLAEGVLIMDEREFIVLANDAFVRNIYKGEALLGLKASELQWVQPAVETEFPWQTALRNKDPVLGMPMTICDRSGEIRRLLVNATRIVDGKGVARGLIATFDDVTMMHRTNERLNLTIEQLNQSQLTISEQNRQLKILASSDPLTDCLNRRSFFSQAELALKNAVGAHQHFSFLMLDVDHFKSINDRFGHAVGDNVLVALVDLVKRIGRGDYLFGRYGGEEFCIAVVGLAERDVERLAEHIRSAVSQVTAWLPNQGRVTISIGIACCTGVACEIGDLVDRADQALYAAKTSGRNRVVNWSKSAAESGRSAPVLDLIAPL
jgi:diguanylate cyclase (GGDEF)-like protein/PAS domain S-box-containing protein